MPSCRKYGVAPFASTDHRASTRTPGPRTIAGTRPSYLAISAKAIMLRGSRRCRKADRVSLPKAAGRGNPLARQPSGIVGGQEHCNFGDVLRLSETSQWGPRHDLLFEVAAD